jgi:hypothetical protein
MRSRFSTTTVVDSKYLVPWLDPGLPRGGLAYSPAELPARDYFFQYTLDPPWNLQPEDQSARASLLRQSPKGERARTGREGWPRHGFASNLWRAAQQSYSLDLVMGVRKFGPHHMEVKTFLSNIQITTFFAGEFRDKDH